MKILINKQNNDKFKLGKLFLLPSGIIPLSFLPTSGLFCYDVTQISFSILQYATLIIIVSSNHCSTDYFLYIIEL